MKEKVTKNRPFGMRDKLAYAAGDLGCNMSFALKGTLQTFWLVYMTMETGLLSALLLIVQIWDAINDPMIGSMIDADKRKYKLGKFKTYILIGAIGLLVAGALCFIPVPKADLWVKVLLFIVGYVVWDAFYTVANVPYGSMLSLVTDNNLERAQLSTWRSIGSMIGNMLPMVILPMIIWKDHTYDGSGVIPGLEGVYHTNPITNKAYEIGEQMINPLTHKNVQDLLGQNVFWAALIMGILGFIFFIYMIKTITLRVDEQSVKIEGDNKKVNIFRSFGTFLKNRAAVGATLAAMAMFLGMNSATTATTIMFATHFGKASLSGVASVVGFLPMFFFMPFINKIVDKFGKKEASTIGALVSLIGGALMFIFPIIGNTTLSMVMYIVALSIFGIGMGFYTCVSWAMMADAIEYNEWKMHSRDEGTVYSLHSFFRKLAQGLGPSIVLLIMSALGYDSDLGTVGQSAQTAMNMCWLVAGLYLFSGIVMFVAIAFIYNLDKKKVAQITDELNARRIAEGVNGAKTTEEVVSAPVEEVVEENDPTETKE
ncbi:MAG: MFS transporter [Clostridia bacterium]|nr:MFS transporter [Clostridia bacterium]